VGLVVPHRGLKQGDPLSPYPFILDCEDLTSIIKKAEAKRICKKLKCVKGLHPSHSYCSPMIAFYFQG